MTYGHSLLIYSLWVLGPLMLGSIAVRMLRDGSRREFPMFFNYCVFNGTVGIFMLLVEHFGNYLRYFEAYWATNVVGMFFGMAVIYEVFTTAFRPFEGLRHLGKIAFQWIAVLSVVGAILIGFTGTAQSPTRALITAALNLERTIRFMQIALVLMLFTASKQIGMSMRSRAFGVALGFGVYASASMFVAVIAQGLTHVFLLTVLSSSMYLLTIMVWSTYFFLPALKESPIMVPVTSPLVRWNEAALAFGHSGGRVFYANDAEPFIPHVERLVDRVFDKDMPR